MPSAALNQERLLSAWLRYINPVKVLVVKKSQNLVNLVCERPLVWHIKVLVVWLYEIQLQIKAGLLFMGVGHAYELELTKQMLTHSWVKHLLKSSHQYLKIVQSHSFI